MCVELKHIAPVCSSKLQHIGHTLFGGGGCRDFAIGVSTVPVLAVTEKGRCIISPGWSAARFAVGASRDETRVEPATRTGPHPLGAGLALGAQRLGRDGLLYPC
jgi:hypothetical protein